jgi:hypothetical protein
MIYENSTTLATAAADPAAYVALPMRWKVSGGELYMRHAQILHTVKDSINRLEVGKDRKKKHGRCEQGELDHHSCLDVCHGGGRIRAAIFFLGDPVFLGLSSALLDIQCP